MNFDIHYPLYLVPHGGGYLSIVNPESNSEPGEPSDGEIRQMLVVCSSQELVMRLIYQFEILSSPKALHSDREFQWLLKSLKPPVTQVVFDPKPKGEDVNAVEIVDISELVDQRLKPDNSPWNYPVFAVAIEEGFLSIDADDGAGEIMTLIAIFSTKELALEYMEKAKRDGTLCKLSDLAQARKFVESVDPSFAVAIALDPEVRGEQRVAKYCFSIETLLEKYLVTV